MNPCDSHLLEGVFDVVQVGTASWTRRYYRSWQGQQRDLGLKARDWEGGCPKSYSDSVPGGLKLAAESRVSPLTGTSVGLTPENVRFSVIHDS